MLIKSFVVLSVHRFSSNGKHNDRAGWYVLHDDGIAAGCFGDWRTSVNQSWRADIGRTLSYAEEAEHRDRVRRMQLQREAEESLLKTEAQCKAQSIWKQAIPTSDTHAYLIRKRIKAHGAKLLDDVLVLPLRNDMAELYGHEVVQRAIDNAIEPLTDESLSWPDPQPITFNAASEPYPLDGTSPKQSVLHTEKFRKFTFKLLFLFYFAESPILSQDDL